MRHIRVALCRKHDIDRSASAQTRQIHAQSCRSRLRTRTPGPARPNQVFEPNIICNTHELYPSFGRGFRRGLLRIDARGSESQPREAQVNMKTMRSSSTRLNMVP